MSFADLTPEDLETIGRALKAAADGPFFPDWEFHTLFGVERKQVREVAARWPDVDHGDQDVDLAINGAFVNLWGYPHGMEEEVVEWVGVTSKDLRDIHDRWRKGAATANEADAIADPTSNPLRPRVLALFQKIRDDFADLESELVLKHPHMDVALEWAEQRTLGFDMGINLQGDELHLWAGEAFWLEWFPCTDEETVDLFEQAVRGLLSGDHRIVEFVRRDRPLKARLERWRENRWRCIGTSARIHIPLGWGMRQRILRREVEASSDPRRECS